MVPFEQISQLCTVSVMVLERFHKMQSLAQQDYQLLESKIMKQIQRRVRHDHLVRESQRYDLPEGLKISEIRQTGITHVERRKLIKDRQQKLLDEALYLIKYAEVPLQKVARRL